MPIDELYACGGLPEKNQLLMQIYADVTEPRDQASRRSAQTPALGSAMFGAVAAGAAAGGYDDIVDAADEDGAPEAGGLPSRTRRRTPSTERLYAEYMRLHDYFGRGENDVMKTLHAIRDEVSA